jgi:hypothetical protein
MNSSTVLHSPRVSSVDVDAPSVPNVNLGGRTGLVVTTKPKTSYSLNEEMLRRSLQPLPGLQQDAFFEIIFDESASVRGGNDVIGLRHDIVRVVLTHLARQRNKRSWFVHISTFDATSPLDLDRTRLDKQGLSVVTRALRRPTAGGSSMLAPSLQRSSSRLVAFAGPTILLVLSDFELYDIDPAGALAALVDAPATHVVAVSLNTTPPNLLVNSRVLTTSVSAESAPIDLARPIVDAAKRCLTPRIKAST